MATLIKNQAETKAVRILCDNGGTFRAFYLDTCGGTETLLDAKSFARETSARKWAIKQIG